MYNMVVSYVGRRKVGSGLGIDFTYIHIFCILSTGSRSSRSNLVALRNLYQEKVYVKLLLGATLRIFERAGWLL